MANPQLENGFTQIADEIMEALMRTNLSAYQSRILWAILRKTYGWQKQEDWISNSQFVEMTGIRKQHISRSIRDLLNRNIVTKSGCKIAFNKNYTQWRELPKQVTVTSLGNKVTNSGNGVTCTGEHNIQLNNKENIYVHFLEEKFKEFYSLYLRKNGKQDACTAWLQLFQVNGNKPSKHYDGELTEDRFNELITALKLQNEYSFNKKEKKFIPHPAKWLRDCRWQDEIDIEKDWRA